MAAARTWSLDTLAEAAGRAPLTLRQALTLARTYEAETGTWPAGQIPKPEPVTFTHLIAGNTAVARALAQANKAAAKFAAAYTRTEAMFAGSTASAAEVDAAVQAEIAAMENLQVAAERVNTVMTWAERRDPVWRQARRDVKKWVQDRQAQAPHPHLLDRDWLDHQYTAGKATPLGRSAESIGRELGEHRSTVINYLEAAGIPIRASGHQTKLAGLTLADFEADLRVHGTQAAAAAARGVTHVTWARAKRRLETGGEPPDAVEAREKAAAEAAEAKDRERAEAAEQARAARAAAAREKVIRPRREQAAMAQRVLDRGYRLGVSGERNPLTAHAIRVLETRVAYPEASMVELADLAGVAEGVRISRGGFSSTLNALLGWQNPEVSVEGQPIPDRA